MSGHPFNESYITKAGGAVLIIGIVSALSLLTWLYGGKEIYEAIYLSLSYLSPIFLSIYFYWFFRTLSFSFVRRLAIITGAHVVSFGVMYLVSTSVLRLEWINIVIVLPLYLIFSILIWVVFELWYSILSCKRDFCVENQPAPLISEVEKRSVIDKISIKDGSNIVIVKLTDLLFIQAYGDYVLIHSDTGKYIKEQTMKFYELNLPGEFVRIHRSCIVNAEKIARVEQYGKESYNVYLKNGMCLKASSSGYKLLKERLLL